MQIPFNSETKRDALQFKKNSTAIAALNRNIVTKLETSSTTWHDEIIHN